MVSKALLTMCFKISRTNPHSGRLYIFYGFRRSQFKFPYSCISNSMFFTPYLWQSIRWVSVGVSLIQFGSHFSRHDVLHSNERLQTLSLLRGLAENSFRLENCSVLFFMTWANSSQSLIEKRRGWTIVPGGIGTVFSLSSIYNCWSSSSNSELPWLMG